MITNWNERNVYEVMGYTAQSWFQPFTHRHVSLQSCFWFSEFRSPMSPRFLPTIQHSFCPQCNTSCSRLTSFSRNTSVPLVHSFSRNSGNTVVARISQLVTEYQERLRRMQHVPGFSYGRRMLRDDSEPNIFFSPTYSLTRQWSAIRYDPVKYIPYYVRVLSQFFIAWHLSSCRYHNSLYATSAFLYWRATVVCYSVISVTSYYLVIPLWK
jgi:hypothetical protein